MGLCSHFRRGKVGRPQKTDICVTFECGEPFSAHAPREKKPKRAKAEGEQSQGPTATTADQSATPETSVSSSEESPTPAESGVEVVDVKNIDEAKTLAAHDAAAGFTDKSKVGDW